jgi:hypothetical protein
MKGDTDTKKIDHNILLPSSAASIWHGSGMHRKPNACL